MSISCSALYFTEMASPVGQLRLYAHDSALVAVLWEHEQPHRVKLSAAMRHDQHPILCEAVTQLTAYFSAQRTHFDLPLAFFGTEFQQQVWQALRSIPFGETRSYQYIATQIGNPKAVRAVGAANGKNPLSIIVPCHRVVGAQGKLVGFAGGLANKQLLLDLEKVKKDQ